MRIASLINMSFHANLETAFLCQHVMKRKVEKEVRWRDSSSGTGGKRRRHSCLHVVIEFRRISEHASSTVQSDTALSMVRRRVSTRASVVVGQTFHVHTGAHHTTGVAVSFQSPAQGARHLYSSHALARPSPLPTVFLSDIIARHGTVA